MYSSPHRERLRRERRKGGSNEGVGKKGHKMAKTDEGKDQKGQETRIRRREKSGGGREGPRTTPV
jgi:hypothetical protein